MVSVDVKQHFNLHQPTATHIINDTSLSGSFPAVFEKTAVNIFSRNPLLMWTALRNSRPVSNLSVPTENTDWRGCRWGGRGTQPLFTHANCRDFLCASEPVYHAGQDYFLDFRLKSTAHGHLRVNDIFTTTKTTESDPLKTTTTTTNTQQQQQLQQKKQRNENKQKSPLSTPLRTITKIARK